MRRRPQAQNLRSKIDQTVVVVVGNVMERNVDGHDIESADGRTCNLEDEPTGIKRRRPDWSSDGKIFGQSA